MIMVALVLIVAAGFVMLVFAAALHPVQGDKKDARSEDEDKNDDGFHDEYLPDGKVAATE